MDNGVVVDQGQVDAGVDQSHSLKLAGDVGEFHGIFFEEFAACGHVEEEVFDHHVAAFGACGGFLSFDAGTVDDKAAAHFGVGGAGAEFDLSHGANRGEGFAAEAHGVEREEVVGLLDFRCGMTLEGHARVGLRHSAAIVNDLNQRSAGVADNHFHGGCSGVNGVFNQFLDHRSGSLDDLAGSNLVGN